MNVYDIFIIVLIAALLAGAIVYIVKNRRKGGCTGCGGCESCGRNCGKRGNNGDTAQKNEDTDTKSQ